VSPDPTYACTVIAVVMTLFLLLLNVVDRPFSGYYQGYLCMYGHTSLHVVTYSSDLDRPSF